MSIYDVKSTTQDLVNKSITLSGKRLAFFVPNMFNKMSSGFGKKVAILLATPAPVVEEPKHVIKSPSEIGKVTDVVIPPKEEPVPTQTPEQNIEPVNQEQTTDAADNQAPVENKNESANPVKEKNYDIKVTPEDVNFLKTTTLTSVGAPRKLLISTIFIQKLIGHREKAVSANKPIPTETKVEAAIKPAVVEETKEIETTDSGVAKYVELMKKRKAAIATKQACEKEMTELVNKFGITLDMVNAELAKGNA